MLFGNEFTKIKPNRQIFPPNFSAKFFSALQGITIMSRKKKNPALRKPYTSTFHQSRTIINP